MSGNSSGTNPSEGRTVMPSITYQLAAEAAPLMPGGGWTVNSSSGIVLGMRYLTEQVPAGSAHDLAVHLLRIPETPTVRQVTTWLTRHPDSLTSAEALKLKRVLDHCPELTDTARHVRDFATIMTRLEGERFPAWIAAADDASIPPLRSFARNPRNALPAVIQGLSTPWNSGIAEGRVTDIKAIKRQMAGRAGFRLLRKRVLLVAASRRPQSVTAATAS
jgi:hypothetical protein